MHGINALRTSKIMLLIQYAERLIPDISYICFRFLSLSPIMKVIMAAGIRAKEIDTKNTMKKGDVPFRLFFTKSVTGYGVVVTVKFSLELFNADLRIA